MRICPFKLQQCNDECSLYITPNDLNDFMVTKLSSLGIMRSNEGICSLKILSLSQARYMFENSTTNRRL